MLTKKEITDYMVQHQADLKQYKCRDINSFKDAMKKLVVSPSTNELEE